MDNIGKLFQPASVAVVGASLRPDAVGSVVVANLIRWGFRGDVYPVNPRYEELNGLRCWPDVAALPTTPDAIFLAVPAPKVPALLHDAAQRGVSAACVNASGFADAGPDGRNLEDAVRETVRRSGMALCGPNNMGFINVAGRVPLWTSPDLPTAPAGPVAAISQSGAIAISLTFDAGHFGYSYIVTVGNETGCRVSDYLDYVATDDRVRVVQLYLESVRDPDRFAAAALRAHARGVCLVAVKVGRSTQSRALVSGHTGAVAGEDAVYDAYFRRLGIMRVATLDQMIEATKLALAGRRLRRPGRIAVVTLSGGEAALAADIATAQGVQLAELAPATQDRLEDVVATANARRNPVDAWGKGWDTGRYRDVVDVLSADPGIDGIVCTITPSHPGSHDEAVFAGVARACAAASNGSDKLFATLKMVAAVPRNEAVAGVLEANRLPYLCGVEASFAALAAWRDREDAQRNPIANASSSDRTVTLSRHMHEAELFAALNDGGAHFAPSRAVTSPDQGIRAAGELGYPVALKGTAPDLVHKTELGLVRLNLGTPEALRDAVADMGPRLRRLSRDSAASLVVQAMAPAGRELLVSARNDPQFGTVVVVGLGGIHVELFRDTATRLGPVDAPTAEAMLDDLSGAALLHGFRGEPAVDIAAAARFVSALSLIAAANAERVDALEVNPLIVLPKGKGAVAVDLVVTWHPVNETNFERTAGKVLHEL
jgi:acyl-CoA synthetase (NDP forming)